MAGGTPCARPAVVGAGGGGDTHGVGGVETIAGATVGEGCSGVAYAGDGGPSGKSCTGDGNCKIGKKLVAESAKSAAVASELVSGAWC